MCVVTVTRTRDRGSTRVSSRRRRSLAQQRTLEMIRVGLDDGLDWLRQLHQSVHVEYT